MIKTMRLLLLLILAIGSLSIAQGQTSIFNPFTNPPPTKEPRKAPEVPQLPKTAPETPQTPRPDSVVIDKRDAIGYEHVEAEQLLQLPSVRSAYHLPLNGRAEYAISRRSILQNKNEGDWIHSGHRPYDLREGFLYSYIRNADKDVHNQLYLRAEAFETGGGNREPILGIFYSKESHLYSVNTGKFILGINPILDIGLGKEDNNADLRYHNTRGAEIKGIIDGKVSFYANLTENQARYRSYIDDRADEQWGAVPGAGRSKRFKGQSDVLDYSTATGYIKFQATPSIRVMFGQDKNFIGNGYRSLILSDNSQNYLFLKLNTKLWKIDYQNIFAELANYKEKNRVDGLIEKKYMANHHLSVNLTPDLNIGVFETVVFGRGDSLNSRVMEWHYLNPLIFFRAVEFGLGSPDNVMLGMDFKYNIASTAQLYGQAFLDEFLKGELFSGNGWWANKFGLQAGMRYINALGVNGLDLRGEVNSVRPFTYSARTNLSSYTHYAQSLAHPLGANFTEVLGIANYRFKPDWNAHVRVVSAKYGQDTTAASSVGQNPMISSTIRGADFGNEIGQGAETTLLMADFVLTYSPWHNLDLDLQAQYRKETSDLPVILVAQPGPWYVGAGLRLNMPQKRFDF